MPFARVILALALVSGSAFGATERSLSEHPARTSSRDVKIPRALVLLIEKEYKEFVEKEGKGGALNEGLAKNDDIKRQLLNVTAELTQKRPAALNEEVRIVTPLGGGVVDLAEFVTPLRGAFHLKLLATTDAGGPITNQRVFFVSNSKERLIDGTTFGSGCHKYMEVTNLINEKMRHEGFELFTAEQRYLSIVGGTFVMVGFEKEKLHVGSITFVDSRYPGILCE